MTIRSHALVAALLMTALTLAGTAGPAGMKTDAMKKETMAKMDKKDCMHKAGMEKNKMKKADMMKTCDMMK